MHVYIHIILSSCSYIGISKEENDISQLSRSCPKLLSYSDHLQRSHLSAEVGRSALAACGRANQQRIDDELQQVVENKLGNVPDKALDS